MPSAIAAAAAHCSVRTALEAAQRSGGHRAGSAHLGLTAALRARQRGAGRDDLPKAGGHIEGVADGFLVRLAAAGQRQQDCGQNAAAARRGGRDDPLHAGIALGGLEGLRRHSGEVIAAEAPALLVRLLHLGRVAARKAAAAALGGVVVPAGGLHHLPQMVHRLPAVGLGEAAFARSLRSTASASVIFWLRAAASISSQDKNDTAHSSIPSGSSTFRQVTLSRPGITASCCSSVWGMWESHSSTMTA